MGASPPPSPSFAAALSADARGGERDPPRLRSAAAHAAEGWGWTPTLGANAGPPWPAPAPWRCSVPLLQPAANQLAAAKIGIYGEAGSGKTRTATEIAIGLAKLADPPKPIAFFDTEGGSDFMIPFCADAGVDLLVAKARAFADLMTFMREAEAARAVILIDSISHTWDDLRESYEKKLRRRTGLEIWDWGVIKPEWRRFLNSYLATPCHAIVCGRAQNVYEQVYNESRGKQEVQVTGSRMKTERETGYEPSLLIEMERRPRSDGRGGWDHVATVVKDRSDSLDGQEFSDPGFAEFAPHFHRLNLGGQHRPTDVDGDSQALFDSPDTAIERRTRAEAALEKITDAFALADISTRSAAGKKQAIQLLTEHFGTSAWAEIKRLHVDRLEAGLGSLRVALELEQPEPEPEQEPLAGAAPIGAPVAAWWRALAAATSAAQLDALDAAAADNLPSRVIDAFRDAVQRRRGEL